MAYGTDLGHAGRLGDSSAAALATRERRLGWLCALSVLLIWVTFQLVGRLATRQTLTPWDVTALRHVGAFLAVLPIAVRRGIPRLPPWRAAAIVATSAFGFPIGAYVGFSLAPVELGAVILFGALPIVTALTGWALFRERPSRGAPRLAAGDRRRHRADRLGHGGRRPPDRPGRRVLLRRDLLPGPVHPAAAALANPGAGRDADAVAVRRADLFAGVVAVPALDRSRQHRRTRSSRRLVVQGMVTAVLAMFLYSRAVNALGAGPPTLVAALVPGHGLARRMVAAGRAAGRRRHLPAW